MNYHIKESIRVNYFNKEKVVAKNKKLKFGSRKKLKHLLNFPELYLILTWEKHLD